jgi:hypothetical protein
MLDRLRFTDHGRARDWHIPLITAGVAGQAEYEVAFVLNADSLLAHTDKACRALRRESGGVTRR